LASSQFGFQVRCQTAQFEDGSNGIGHLWKRILFFEVMNPAGKQVDADVVAFLDGGIKRGTLHDRKAVVNGVAIKGSREGTRDDGFDPQAFDGRRGLLPGAATAEIPARDEDVEGAELGSETLPQDFEGMLAEPLRININQMPAGDDDVGIDVVSELEDSALNNGFHA
jgi:hypothetical protein